MWQMQAFRNHQWTPVSHSGQRNEFPTKEEAQAALDLLYPPAGRPVTGGGADIVRVHEVEA